VTAFPERHRLMKNMPETMVCQSSGDQSAPVAVQLKSSTEQFTGKLPGRTLDPEAMTTRFLIQGRVNLLNTLPMISIPGSVLLGIS
jgi:hypothetical protein